MGTENNPALKRVFKNYCKYALGQGRVYAQVRSRFEWLLMQHVCSYWSVCVPAVRRLTLIPAPSVLWCVSWHLQEGVPHINAQQFHRLCQDAGFVEPEGRLSTTGVDVVFYRYRPTGARRLGFKEVR